jgi:hypothetical protein
MIANLRKRRENIRGVSEGVTGTMSMDEAGDALHLISKR